MKLKQHDKCICKHNKKDHDIDPSEIFSPPIGWCNYCFKITDTPCKKFRLDNLSYVERLAKERKLI
jgi:hypothetical protein